ncbi:dihydrofolate reductase family protein [Mycolicibacterium pallens]|uniref:Dihydrofolate reductase family protein n=1 Tax=Mycolicibacterium pallens TaxID=370524 RepID=A0ABX8VIG3_9MYCO|nr:dihydrofolate reductase family protein [Mycolicibacterium pallens]QYL15336.1 dihydrofolate reductase family protein [Mycolicibacterium pallens]
MTALAGTPHSTVHEAESLTDDGLRDLLAYPDGLQHPLFRANFIASIDGAVTLEGSGRKLGTPTDRRVFGQLREVADVVLVGATTAKSKPYENLALGPDAQAWRLSRGLAAGLPVAVVSSRGVVPPAVLSNAVAPPVVFVSASADADARRVLTQSRAHVIEIADGRVASAAIREGLGALGLHRVLVEGGPTLFSQLVSDNEIDELCLTTSPKLVGGPARRIAAADHHVEITMQRRGILVGGDGTVIVRWARY